jgi:hypothetical protein
VSETANDVHEALSKARQMYETGLVNVSIGDENGHKIDGDELLACITGKKTITSDLQAEWKARGGRRAGNARDAWANHAHGAQTILPTPQQAR